MLTRKIFRPDGLGAQTIRRSLQGHAGQNLLLYVGRLAKEKNTATLLRAFKALQRRRPNEFHLLVIGDGPDRTQLRKLQLRTDNVSWIRYCADPCELAGFYRAADLFVHPGVQETFGLAALECQACGTRVVGIRGSYMDNVICHDQESWALQNSADALVRCDRRLQRQEIVGYGAGMLRVLRRVCTVGRVSLTNCFAFFASFAQHIRRS